MKGITGLIVAIGLGIAAALLNFLYLNKEGEKDKEVGFVAVKDAIDPGDRLTGDNLEEVLIPKKRVGNLDEVAVPWDLRHTVVDQPVWRQLKAGSLLLDHDLDTPPPELKFDESLEEGVEERAMFVPMDQRRSVPRLVVPGRYVDFVYTGTPMVAISTPEELAEPNLAPRAARPSGEAKLIGPFRVLALGNRLGRPEVLRSSKTQQVQENVMAVAVKVENGKLEANAQTLLKLINETGGRGVGILLHPPKTANK